MTNAAKVRKMISNLEEIQAHYSGSPEYQGLVSDISKAIQALERVLKSLTG